MTPPSIGLGLEITRRKARGFVNRQSVRFPGNDEYGNIDALQAAISSDTKGTFFALVKFPDVTPLVTNSIITFGDTDAVESIRLDLPTSGNLRGFCRISGSVQWITDTDANGLVNNTWDLVGMVHDGAEAKLKIGNAEPPQAFSTDTNKNRWMSLATGLDNGRVAAVEINSNGVTGLSTMNMDEYGYFNTNLNDAEWTELYNIIVLGQQGGDLRNHSKAANLVSAYHVDGDIVPTMTDYVNGNNGTYVNTTQSEIENDVI